MLTKERDKAHILLGVTVAVRNIDEIMRIIRASNDPNTAKPGVMARKWDALNILPLVKLFDNKAVLNEHGKFIFTEVQAKAIIEMRLQRLTAMEKNKLEEDLKNLATVITEYLNTLGSRESLLEILKEELIKVKEFENS